MVIVSTLPSCTLNEHPTLDVVIVTVDPCASFPVTQPQGSVAVTVVTDPLTVKALVLMMLPGGAA